MSGTSSTGEALGDAGFDGSLVGHAKAPFGEKESLFILPAISGTPADSVVRLAANGTVLFKRALESGAQTSMVPFIESADDATGAVADAKHPPQGARGCAGYTVSSLQTAAVYGSSAR